VLSHVTKPPLLVGAGRTTHASPTQGSLFTVSFLPQVSKVCFDTSLTRTVLIFSKHVGWVGLTLEREDHILHFSTLMSNFLFVRSRRHTWSAGLVQHSVGGDLGHKLWFIPWTRRQRKRATIAFAYPLSIVFSAYDFHRQALVTQQSIYPTTHSDQNHRS
jgi:hypothetical protein